MLTSLKMNLEIKKDPVGYVIGDHSNNSTSKEIPLYIPRLMSNIPQATEKSTDIVEIDSVSDIFVNAAKCRPSSKRKIRCRNYVNGKILNSTAKDLTSKQKVTCTLYNDSPINVYFRIG